MTLIELPNGDWIASDQVVGIRIMTDDRMGPRVIIDTRQHYGHHMLEFDLPEVARQWAREFGQKCQEDVTDAP